MSSWMQRFSTCDFKVTPQYIEFHPQENNHNGNDYLKFLFSERSNFADDNKFQLIKQQNTLHGMSYICRKIDGNILKTCIKNLSPDESNIIIKQLLQFIYLCNKNFHLAKCSIERIFYSQQQKKIYIIEFGNLTRFPEEFQNQQQDSKIDLILAQQIIKIIQKDPSKILNNFSEQTSHQEFFQFYCGENSDINSFYDQNTFKGIKKYNELNNQSLSFLQYSLQYSIEKTEILYKTWDHHVFLMNFFDKVLNLIKLEAKDQNQNYVYVYIKYIVLASQKYLENLEQIKNGQQIDEKQSFIFNYDIDWVELVKNNFKQFQTEINYKIEMHKNQQNYEIKKDQQLQIPETYKLNSKKTLDFESFLKEFNFSIQKFMLNFSNKLQFYLYLSLSIKYCFKAKYIPNLYGNEYQNQQIIHVIHNIEKYEEQQLMNLNLRLKKVIFK